MKWFVFVLFSLASPALSQAVNVKSGDHVGFTRLVLTFPTPADWTLARTEAGYQVVRPKSQDAYNLTDVFRLIRKDRLKSIWVDPTTGALQLAVACACHAIPFEFSANTLVIDLRDGLPPEGSTFELPLSGSQPLPPLGRIATADDEVPSPRAEKAYDWLQSPAATAASLPVAPEQESVTAALDEANRMDDFRSLLVDEVGKGATEGVVNLTPVAEPLTAKAPDTEAAKQARVALEELPTALPGLQVSNGEPPPPLTVKGETCPKDETLSTRDWATPDNPATVLAQAKTNLVTEFDLLDGDRIAAAVRTYLYFGFGAEARNILEAFPIDLDGKDSLLAISYLVDGQPPRNKAFAGMHSCSGSAAFWSVVAADAGADLTGLNGGAVSATFMGLPKHLKSVFAKEVAARLMDAGDSKNAEIIRTSIARATAPGDPIVPMMEAEQSLHSGQGEEAEAKLATIPDMQRQADAFLALVEARYQQRKPVDEKDVIALEAFAFELAGGPQHDTLLRALSHAKALNNDFSAAFDLAKQSGASETEIWSLLADVGTESSILTFVAGTDPTTVKDLPRAAREAFAKRLLAIGLPNVAARWLPADARNPALQAEIELANNDARSALRTLTKDIDGADPDMLATAYRNVGSYENSAQVLISAGKPEEAQRLQRWARDWDQIGSDSSDTWGQLAASRGPAENVDALPPLESGRRHLEDSAKTRQSIADLLAGLAPAG